MTSEEKPPDAIVYPYATHLNVLFPHLAKVDVPTLVSTVKDQWFNQTLCQVNTSVVRLGVMQGEYHWHKHDKNDEFFCLEGEFYVDLEERSLALRARGGGCCAEGSLSSHPRAPAMRHPNGRERRNRTDRRLSTSALARSRCHGPVRALDPRCTRQTRLNLHEAVAGTHLQDFRRRRTRRTMQGRQYIGTWRSNDVQ